MEFQKIDDFNNLEMKYISEISGGYISKNSNLFKHIKLNRLNKIILEKAVYGTPMFRLGKGGKKILILSGIHGNELPPQIANLNLINNIYDKKLNDTLYFIPFASPKSAMLNERSFNSIDLNRASHIKNSLSNQIIQEILKLKIDFVGDFHSTSYNSNPGFESIFASRYPSPESYYIAKFISQRIGSEVIVYKTAGSNYKGAIEDVCNLNGIPAITGEVLCPFASVGEGSVERSYAQMKSFLDYFAI